MAHQEHESTNFIIYRDIGKDPVFAGARESVDNGELLAFLIRWAETEGIAGNLRLRYALRLLLGDHLFSRGVLKGLTKECSLYQMAKEETEQFFALIDPWQKIDGVFGDYAPSRVKAPCREEAALLEDLKTRDQGAFFGHLIDFYRLRGYGEFAFTPFFRWRKGLETVADPDLVTMEQLVGCGDQKAALIRNTESFLEGKGCNNALLYGERGTGKSSMVKALGTLFFEKGLRLIELDKSDIMVLGEIAAFVSEIGLKFIVFIDDLSFENEASEYREFKRILEGSLRRQPDNLLIYATSNRRHLLKEYWQERLGEEVNVRESRDEKLSLSSRFGLTVAFLSPDQKEFLDIVYAVAARRGLAIDRETLKTAALQWEKWHHGRSGRSAVQFVNDLETRLP
ncbi:MAG TPA: ATP-binding protein [Clostridiales bacterium]|nr:ATP-binding protein [Clostridiales bacterium]